MTTITLLTPVSITATGPGPDVDVSRLTGEARVTLTALNTAGTNPTLACKLQGSTGTARGHETLTVGTVDNKLLSAATTANALAAKFTQSGARSLKRVGLMIKKNGTIAAGKKLTAKIKTDNSGVPSATIIGTSSTVDIDTAVSTSYALVVFTFPTPVDLADATVYHVELTCDYTNDATNNVTWRSATVASGGNYVQLDNTTWTATATKSLEVFTEQYTFADITGGGFTTLSTAGNTTVQTLGFNGRSLARFMRLYSTIGGTSSPAFATAATINAARVHEQ